VPRRRAAWSSPGGIVPGQHPALAGGRLCLRGIGLPQPAGQRAAALRVVAVAQVQQPLERLDAQHAVALLLRDLRQHLPVVRAAVRLACRRSCLGELGARLRNSGVRCHETGPEAQPELQRAGVVEARQPVDRFLFQPEVEQPLDEAPGDVAAERAMVLVEAQHGAERALALALHGVALDDDEPRAARLPGGGVELPQQARGVGARRRALPRRNRGARGHKQALAQRRLRHAGGQRRRALQDFVVALEVDQQREAQRLPLGPARRAGCARLQLLDAGEGKLRRAGGGEAARSLQCRGGASAGQADQRKYNPHRLILSWGAPPDGTNSQ